MVTLIDDDVAAVLHRKVTFVAVSYSTSVEPTQSVVSLPKYTKGSVPMVSANVAEAGGHTPLLTVMVRVFVPPLALSFVPKV